MDRVRVSGASSTSSQSVQFQRMEARIYHAAAEGDTGILLQYSSEQLRSFLTPTKNTILHIFIASQSTTQQMSDKMTVQLILAKCPSLRSMANSKGETPLHIAARHGLVGIVQVLINHAKTTAAAAGQEDIESGQMSIICEDMTTKIERSVREMLRKTNEQNETAFHEAARHGHTQVVRLLIDEDDQFCYSANKAGESPLYLAAERGNSRIVSLILTNLKSPAYDGPNGRTALHASVSMDHKVTTAYILDRKYGLEHLSKEVDEKGWTPLHYAAYLNLRDITNILLEHDESAAYIAAKDGKTALHIAAARGFVHIVKLFFTKCPDCFELVDQRGRNALHFAVESSDAASEVVDLILNTAVLGDLKETKDENGKTPLDPFDAAFGNYGSDLDSLEPIPIPERILEKQLQEGNISPPQRTLKPKDDGRSRKEKANNVVDKSDNRGEEDYSDLKEAKGAHLVAAALIATVTFTAGFTIPGGFISENGTNIGSAVLIGSKAFQAFIITDTIALVLSSAAVFIHLLIAMDIGVKKIQNLFNKALPLTLYAMLAMVVAFITGTYAVLSPSSSLAIATCVVGCLFFVLYGYLHIKVVDFSIKVGKGLIESIISCMRACYICLSCQFCNRTWI